MTDEMKEYIVRNNLSSLVRELKEAGFTTDEAVEQVYDSHHLSREDFTKKYLS